MARIDEVAFAKLVCDGKVYRAPVLVYPDRVDGRWWRKDGTVFSPEDFDAVIDAAPAAVVLGVGFSAKVQVPESTVERFRDAGIECIVADTPEAVSRFNELSATRRVVGAFHLF
jgi:hypothetical protein